MPRQNRIADLLESIDIQTLGGGGGGKDPRCTTDQTPVMKDTRIGGGPITQGRFGEGAGSFGDLTNCINALNRLLGDPNNLPGRIQRHHERQPGFNGNVFREDYVDTGAVGNFLTDNFLPGDIISYGLDDDLDDRAEEIRILMEKLRRCMITPGCDTGIITKEIEDVQDSMKKGTKNGDRNIRIINNMRQLRDQHFRLQRKIYELATSDMINCRPCHFETPNRMPDDFTWVDEESPFFRRPGEVLPTQRRTGTEPWRYPWLKRTIVFKKSPPLPDIPPYEVPLPKGAPEDPGPIHAPTQWDTHPLPREYQRGTGVGM